MMYTSFKPYAFLLFSLLMVGCSSNDSLREGDYGTIGLLYQTAAPVLKAHWIDQATVGSQTPAGQANFQWDDCSDELISVLHNVGGKNLKWEDGAYYTYTKVESNAEDHSKAIFTSLHNIHADAMDDITQEGDDHVFSVSPVMADNGSTITADGSSAVAILPMPSVFEQSAPNQLDADVFKNHAYIYAHTTTQPLNGTTLVGKSVNFEAAAAIVRFNVTNQNVSGLRLLQVLMKAVDANGVEQKVFPNKMQWTARESNPISELDDRTGYYSSIAANLDDADLAKGDTANYYAYVFPAAVGSGNSLKFTIETNYLTYEMKMKVPTQLAQFDAGKMYTFTIALTEKEVQLSTIEIADCQTYDVRTEQTNVVVLGGDADWSQTEDVSASMEFIGLDMTYTDPETHKEYDVLWGTCNLGAKESIETGRLYSWGEYMVKKDELYSPSGYTATVATDLSGAANDPVRNVMGSGHWQWVMPTQAMWQELITSCTWEWVTVKKVNTEAATEDNLDFDASVWKISRRNAENKIIGTILLPITGFMGEKTDAAGTYGKNTVARCNYWTSTPVTNVAGATQTSYALTTTYSINGNTGTMSDPALTEQQRYQGFAIRPVLLKEK